MAGSDVERLREGMAEFTRTRRVPHELLDPDVEWQTMLDTYRGHEGVDAWCEDIERTFPELKGEFEEPIEAAPGRVVIAGRFKGLHGASGIDSGASFALLWIFKDGRVVRLRSFATIDEALRAAAEG